MTKKPSRVRVLMMPYQDDADKDAVGYPGPATVPTGLPNDQATRTPIDLAACGQHHLRDGKARRIPRRFNLTPRCVVRNLEKVEAWLE